MRIVASERVISQELVMGNRQVRPRPPLGEPANGTEFIGNMCQPMMVLIVRSFM